jgi:hypothetical protein
MASRRTLAGALLAAAALLACLQAASAQDIVDNLYPKNGDVCADKGDQWRTIKLGKCEAGTKCQSYKRGVYKCISTNPALGSLPLGAVCYNETAVDTNNAAGEAKRKYFRERNCVWMGADVQGTPVVQCLQQAANPKIYRCAKIVPLGQKGCYTVSGSMIWGKWNDNQAYDACNNCPCTPPNKTKCKSGPCKYPLCRCNEPCDAARRAQRCATS